MDNKNMQNQVGHFLEQQAECYLLKHGLKIISRNFHCRQGEIDLILLDKEQFVFTEVRGRSNIAFGSPHETVHMQKQNRITTAARYYIAKHPAAINCRFDVISFLIQKKRSKIEIKKVEWLKNAIHVDGWSW